MDLQELLIKAAKSKKSDPNFLGEALRAAAFLPDGNGDYGCYSTFKVSEDFKPVDKNSELGAKLIKLLGVSDFDDPDDPDNEYDEFILEASSLYSAGDIHMAWYWDGDGTLLFVIDSEKLAIINTDCKKDYEWRWIKWC